MLYRLFKYFINWLIFLLPLFLLFWFIKTIFSFVFPSNMELINSIIFWVLFLFIVVLTGYFLNKWLKFYFHKKIINFLSNFPIIKNIVHLFQKLFLVIRFWKWIFDQPVLYTNNNWEIKIWFVTKDDLAEFWLETYSSVYFPNPFSFMWELLFIEKSRLEVLEKDSKYVSAFLFSAWVLKDDVINKDN